MTNLPSRGKRLKSGKRTQRVSWIAALKQGKLFVPMTFEGSCNRDLFEMWLEECLVPQLQPGNIKAGGRKNYSLGTLPHRY